MLRSLYDGVSGLRNTQVRMDVIGNNIANVNTVGFKSGRVTFKESFAQLIQSATQARGGQGGANAMQIGLGMQIGSIDQVLTQGATESTGRNTDVAINGSSFFVVRKGNDTMYTRAGNFQLDDAGNLVSQGSSGIVQGQMYIDGVAQGGVTDIQLPFGQKVPARATQNSSMTGNLNASAPIFTGDFTKAADRALPENEKAWAETQTVVYDSQGAKHDVKIQMWKTGDNEWNWRLDPMTSAITQTTTTNSATPPTPFTLPTVPAGYEIDPANVTVVGNSGKVYSSPGDWTFTAGSPPKITFAAGMPASTGLQISYAMTPTTPAAGVNSGVLTFDAQGILSTEDPFNVDFAVQGGEPLQIAVKFGGDVNGLTQFAASSSTASLGGQDGYASGLLQNFAIDRTGFITGYFSNGTTSTLARMVLADFRNPGGMTRAGDNMYQASEVSGEAMIGFAGESASSQLTSQALEMSNVDLAQEFTNMIVAQRAFQANGKVVTTSDEILQELLNIKR